MSKRSRVFGFLGISVCALGAVLASCSQPAKRPSASTILRPDYDMVAAIRAAGRNDDSVVQVQPVRDARTRAFLHTIHAEERAGEYEKAAHALDAALKLAPHAPDLLQDRAEMAVRLQHWDRAVKLAMRSWTLGPKVGSLCARNWQTVVEMRKLHGNAAGAASARKQEAKCRVAGVKRY